MKPIRCLAVQALVLTCLASASWLVAQQPPAEKKELFKKDFDKKGFFQGFGPGGFGGPFGQETRLVKEFDKDGDGRLNAEERQAAREFIKKNPGPGGKMGFGPKGPGGPGGFSPGNFVVKPLIEALDTDQDGKLTRAELQAGIKKFMADHAKDDALTELQLADALNRLMPRPMGFPGGPPGFGPPPKDGDKKKDFDKKGPPSGFGRFGPGIPLASSFLQRADKNKDEKATLEELTAAAVALFKEADKNRDDKLDDSELSAAIAQLFPAPGFGPPGFAGKREPAKPGPHVAPADVKSYPDASLYEPTVLRTFFLEFESKDWEAELADFHNTDVEVPVTLTVDGKRYPNVGVHFRGMSSYMGVPAGYKRSLGLALDFADKKQRLYGVRTLNLLNANGDPSLLSSVLYSHIARKTLQLPTPKANVVKVVINGESWGLYSNVQQFNKDFVAENFKKGGGARWKVRGNPGADGGLAYLGDNVDDYKRRYQIKSADEAKSWKALIELCRVLDKTPLDELEKALTPILDIDGALKFLALDVVLSNSDGYWIRASDYSIVRDAKGKFHLVPHDMNEAFQPTMGFGPGFGKGPKGFGGPGEGFKKFDGPKKDDKDGPEKQPFAKGPGGFGPDPLVGLDDTRKPLRSRLLAVPSLKARYLEYVRKVADEGLSWKNLGPVVAQYRELLTREVESETHTMMPLAAFAAAVADAPPQKGAGPMRPGVSLRTFADGRRDYILNHPALARTQP